MLMICKANHNLMSYLIHSNIGTSIRAVSDEGSGKGIFMQFMRAILGKGFLQTHDASRDLMGDFNEHLARAILVFSDEAFFTGNKAAADKFKGMVSEKKMLINGKYKTAFEVRSEWWWVWFILLSPHFIPFFHLLANESKYEKVNLTLHRWILTCASLKLPTISPSSLLAVVES